MSERGVFEGDRLFAIIVFLLGVLILLAVFLTTGHTTDYGQWKGYDLTDQQRHYFTELLQPSTGYICCSIADGYPVDATFKDGHYWFTYQNQPYTVPDGVVIHKPNPLGVAVAWLFENPDGKLAVRCFLPTSDS